MREGMVRREEVNLQDGGLNRSFKRDEWRGMYYMGKLLGSISLSSLIG